MPDPIAISGVAGCILAAAAISHQLARQSKGTAATEWGGNEAVRSLAGYLVLFVFMHHASIWLTYLHSGNWSPPDSRLLLHLGQSSIVVLLMAIGYAQTSQLLEVDNRAQWRALCGKAIKEFVWPYWLSVAGLCAVVAVLSGGAIKSSFRELLGSLGRWMAFGLFGTPDLNRLENTWIAMAGSTWILAYAVISFALLPLLIAVHSRVFLPVGLTVSCLALAWIAVYPVHDMALAAIAVGAAIRVLANHGRLRHVLGAKASAICALGLPLVVGYLFGTAYDWVALVLLAVSFTVVGCGNPLLGILQARSSCLLGTLSPCVYLFHGLFLYLGARVIVLAGGSSRPAPLHFWAGLVILTPCLIAAAWAARNLIGAFERRRG